MKVKLLSILIALGAIIAIIGFATNDDEAAKEQKSDQVAETEQAAKGNADEEEQKVAEEQRQKETADQQEAEELEQNEHVNQKTDELAQAIGLEAVLISRVVDSLSP
ncbi:hypothetical protein [Bacillus timonensis]|uniref:hypothetical protein n=1 Tax=Bacillus timonensis TaxID=1033734 RepID=UPI0002890A29|nr:hypothetical protein [Bacillus timonensis]